MEVKDRLRRVVHELAETQRKLKQETAAHEERSKRLRDSLIDGCNVKLTNPLPMTYFMDGREVCNANHERGTHRLDDWTDDRETENRRPRAGP